MKEHRREKRASSEWLMARDCLDLQHLNLNICRYTDGSTILQKTHHRSLYVSSYKHYGLPWRRVRCIYYREASADWKVLLPWRKSCLVHGLLLTVMCLLSLEHIQPSCFVLLFFSGAHWHVQGKSCGSCEESLQSDSFLLELFQHQKSYKVGQSFTTTEEKNMPRLFNSFKWTKNRESQDHFTISKWIWSQIHSFQQILREVSRGFQSSKNKNIPTLHYIH